MARRRPTRLVFSTDDSTCITCGWPSKQCRCSVADDAEPVPPRIVAKLRIEKSGRRGKTVTVIDGLPRNQDFLKETAGRLKKLCGTGGAVRDGLVELQGDHRDRLRKELQRDGWTVKG